MPVSVPWLSSGIAPIDLIADALMSLLLILVSLVLGRRRRRLASRIGLGMGIPLLATSIGLLFAERVALPEPAGKRTGKTVAAVPGGENGARLYASDSGRFLNPRGLYGTDVDQAERVDAMPIYGDFLSRARIAELVTFPGGEGVLAARFDNAADVAEAARAYLQRFRVEMATGDLTQGLRGQRGDLSDRVEILLDGEMLMVWTARTGAALAARRWASQAGAPQDGGHNGNRGGNK